ncbi:RHS repeat domain-containing protein [Leadbetterella sp. DM7]|uniref:RHS repeat domain-containing protein n=1 Tax=Leadbetterella sp. DM7 TaxID=3235085 RepID=UPI00349EA098
MVDYTWHIRGGLLGINLNGSGSPVPDGTAKDLFSYKLEYETAGQWGGNIGKQSWNHVNGTTPVGIRNYTYTYDTQSRLKTATYSGIGSENYSIPNVNYSKNGNITQLQRNGKTGGSFGLMDNLSYTYSGNRLTSVNDGVSGNNEVDFVKRGSGGYTYYANGALKSDENEQITNITYNTYLNLPEEINLSDGRWIRYTYDGDGELIRTQYSTGEYWEYADGFIFKNGQPYQYGIPDGRAIFESGVWKLEFDYKDHLGNTRVSFKEGSSGVVQTARTDFDPWGVRLNGTGSVNAFQNRWELQGKEKESTFNLNRVDFGARVYNPTIGRWDRVDALADHPNQIDKSPYAAFWNNPTNLNDPDGNCPICPYIVGAASGAAFDYGIQVAENLIDGKGWSSFTDVDGKSIAISAGAGATGVGLTKNAGKLLQLIKGGSKIDDVVNVADDVAKTAAKVNESGGKNIDDVGKRFKNRLPDKGESNSMQTNKSGTTTKKYGSDGNVQKNTIKVMVKMLLKTKEETMFMIINLTPIILLDVEIGCLVDLLKQMKS